MKQLECVFGEVQLISLDKFLDILSIKQVTDKTRRQEFNTCIGYGIADSTKFSQEDSDVSTYERKAAFLFNGDTKSILKAALFYQARYDHMFNQSKLEILEELVVRHMTEMGETRYLVRVAPRTWMAANTGDFQILKNKHGYGLACMAKGRTSITTINRLTIDQARVEIDKIIGTGAAEEA